ncbi:sugar phosphate isomerase/epimerase family protein [Desulfobotulus sp.]|uniref:sugar phosphate isomerase/epimerase family protein n=1 Tax=Desulfobotulus sp. TaxID=1940337 RepID=UPI002A371AD3|nr:sugar phosphate isomerase/epimerase family protein [Desulfobotulus sp.]MDY0163785.1 sugar phosphate isomerase/epimerase family protein [Desulfobotulus sp.]
MNPLDIAAIPEKIRGNVQVNLPFRMRHLYMESFLALGLNPEIGIDAETLDNVGMEEFKAVARAFQKKGRRITLHGPFMDLSPGSPDPAIRRASMERMQQFLDVLVVFEPFSVVCHGGWESRRYDWIRDAWYQNAVVFWKEVAGFVKKRRSRLYLENVYEDKPEDMLSLLELLHSEGVGFCLDTGHTAAFGSRDLSRWVAVLGAFVCEIHLHDNKGVSDAHLPPGQGKIDFSALKILLQGKGERPFLTLEPHEEKNLYPSLDWIARELGDLF